MKANKLMKNVECDFPVKKISRFDPHIEYFLLDEEQKDCYILRLIQNDKIMLINLKYASPHNYLIDKSEFSDLCDKYTLLELPHFTGGCSDYTSKIINEENEARKEMFEYLLNNGYFD